MVILAIFFLIQFFLFNYLFVQDTIKKRMQIQVLTQTITPEGLASSIPNYTSFFHCIRRTHADEGLRGFYKVGKGRGIKMVLRDIMNDSKKGF